MPTRQEKAMRLYDALGDLAYDTSHLRKHTSIATSNEAFRLHGTGGLFTDACREREVINAVLAPMGLDMPAVPTLVEDPLFPTLTGIDPADPAVGTVPDEVCEPGPAPQGMSICDITFPLGRGSWSSNTIDVDEVITRACRGDTRDMVLWGDHVQRTGFGNLASSSLSDQNRDDILNNEFTFQMHVMGRECQRWICQTKWTGDPANSTAGGGYKEFWGFDNLIKTGWEGFVGGVLTPCPHLDSDVKDFEGQCLTGEGPNNIYEYLQTLEYSIWNRARMTGLNPFSAVIVMRPQVWHELSLVWPWLANTRGIVETMAIFDGTATSYGRVNANLDGRDMTMETLEMRRNPSLVLNGRMYPVVLDDCIPTTGAPTYESSIYFIPMTVLGGQLVTYYEYKDYREVGSMMTAPMSGKFRMWTDDGRYMWTTEEKLWCIRMHKKFEPRIIMRTPQLAGRIDNVAICPIQILNDPLDPADPGTYIHNVV